MGRTTIGFAIALCALLGASGAVGDDLVSENFRLRGATLSGGGGLDLQGTTIRATGTTIGQSSPLGTSTSPSGVTLHSGFWHVAGSGEPQLDSDADGVPDQLDNCVDHFNPRLGDPDFGTPARLAFQTTTGGQLDDDADGFGNVCDAKFGTGGTIVGGIDLSLQIASFNKDRSGNDCGTTGDLPCAQFDLDNAGIFIGGVDVNLARQLFNAAPGPKCALCPLACEGVQCPAE